jgi:hypothetical protein
MLRQTRANRCVKSVGNARGDEIKRHDGAKKKKANFKGQQCKVKSAKVLVITTVQF